MRHARSKHIHNFFVAILIMAGGFHAPVMGQPVQAADHDGEGPIVKKLRLITSARPLEPAAADSDLSKLLKARYNSAIRRLAYDLECYTEGRATIDKLLPAVRSLRDSGLELRDAPADQVFFLELYWELSRRTEDIAEDGLREGNTSEQDVEQARYARLEAEIQLCRARERLKSVRSR